MPHANIPITLSDEDRQRLQYYIDHPSTEHIVKRCRMILAAAGGESDGVIAKALGTSYITVSLWRERVKKKGIGCLFESSPRVRCPYPELEARIKKTIQTPPKNGIRWTHRMLETEIGVSKSTIKRVLQRSVYFNDPVSIAGLTDVLGMFLCGPSRVLALCVGSDKKAGKITGLAPLFKALTAYDGKVDKEKFPRQQNKELLTFLSRLKPRFPGKVPIHLMIDNETYLQARILTWFNLNPRFVPYIIPTGFAWQTSIEQWFLELAKRPMRKDSFPHASSLQEALKAHMEQGKVVFVWTAE